MSCGNSKYTNFIPITGGPTGQKDVVLIPGPGIGIDDLSDVNTYKFRISAEPIEDLSVTLTLVAREAGISQTNPVLAGTVIDEVNLSWVYNKAIATQTLSNTASLTPPILDDVTFLYDYTGQNIQTNSSFTIQGNDGLGQPGSIASNSKSITFGNLMFLGAGPIKTFSAYSGIEAFLESLSSVIKTSRNHTYYATGGENEFHFVAYPKVWGLGTFQKNLGPGGYNRLKRVGSILKINLEIGDIESDILITNSKGFEQAYYVYQSDKDWIGDNVTPFVLS
jgi:hypothetical protein